MLDASLNDFLSHQTLMYAGTSSADGTPQVHRVFGWRTDKAAGTFTAFIPAPFTQGLADNVAANPRIAVNVAHTQTFESYQFKGRVISVTDGDEAVAAEQEELRALCVNAAQETAVHLVPFWQYHPTSPCTVVTFKVDEAYAQSPRPGTGHAVEKREA